MEDDDLFKHMQDVPEDEAPWAKYVPHTSGYDTDLAAGRAHPDSLADNDELLQAQNLDMMISRHLNHEVEAGASSSDSVQAYDAFSDGHDTLDSPIALNPGEEMARAYEATGERIRQEQVGTFFCTDVITYSFARTSIKPLQS